MAYGITDRRIMIIVDGRSRQIQSWKYGEDAGIRRTIRADGSGDIAFGGRAIGDGELSHNSTMACFMGIDDVRKVERLVLELLQNGDTAV